jgi:hypothetical protein
MAGEMTLRELETLARKAGIRHEVAARAIVLRIAEWLDIRWDEGALTALEAAAELRALVDPAGRGE